MNENQEFNEKGFIFISGTKTPYEGDEISYETLVNLYNQDKNLTTNPDITYTVSWESKPEKKSGTLVAGDVVQLIKGIKFNVKHTNRS